MGDATTILKLFEGTPQAAPFGLSDWDQAFLKSLYATEQISKTQRSYIANAIVRAELRKCMRLLSVLLISGGAAAA